MRPAGWWYHLNTLEVKLCHCNIQQPHAISYAASNLDVLAIKRLTTPLWFTVYTSIFQPTTHAQALIILINLTAKSAIGYLFITLIYYWFSHMTNKHKLWTLYPRVLHLRPFIIRAKDKGSTCCDCYNWLKVLFTVLLSYYLELSPGS